MSAAPQALVMPRLPCLATFAPMAATIQPESTLKDLGVASLEAIEMIFDIEEHFDINFPEQQGANFDTDTAQSLVDAVQKALDDKAAASEGSK